MRKILLALLLVVSVSFAEETKQEKLKCYEDLSKILVVLHTYMKEKVEAYKILIPMMQRDGFTCEEIHKFIMEGK